MKSLKLFSFALLVAFATSSYSSAALMLQSNQNDTTLSAGFFGQSFTTTGGGPFDNITFNWYADNTPTAVAQGNLFLLDGAYTGTPGGLDGLADSTVLGAGVGGATVLTSVAASGNLYTFSPSFTLQPLTTYFAYMDGAGGAFDSGGGFGITRSNSDTFGGGANVGAVLASTTNYASDTNDLGFLVTGLDAAAVPEPSSLAMIGVFALGFLGYRRRKNKSQSL